MFSTRVTGMFGRRSDIDSGSAWNRRLWLETDDSIGRPDGACVDADGCYWSARFKGGRVIRFTPDGRIDREIHLPCSQVTMCAFGGADLRTLFITTAREGLDAAALAREPLAGGIRVDGEALEVAGRPGAAGDGVGEHAAVVATEDIRRPTAYAAARP